MLTIDVICPWIFIGKRRLEEALAGRLAAVRRHPSRLYLGMPAGGIEPPDRVRGDEPTPGDVMRGG